MSSEGRYARPSCSSGSGVVNQHTCCAVCRKMFHVKEVLRLVIRESAFHVLILIIRLKIRSGSIVEASTKIVNFFKLSHSTNSFYPSLENDSSKTQSNTFETFNCDNIRLKTRYCFHHSRKIHWDNWMRRQSHVDEIQKNENENEDEEEDVVEALIYRFANYLCVDTFSITQTIDSILTSLRELVIDFDLKKLRQLSRKSDNTIEDLILNMFWQPKCNQKDNCSQKKKGTGWFSSADRGHVVPFHNMSHYHVETFNTVESKLLLRCIHVVEDYAKEIMSWYLEPYFYNEDTYVYPPIESYEHFLSLLPFKKIENSQVTVINDNPLLLGAHFAHVVASSFCSSKKYLRNYIYNIGLLQHPVIHLQRTAPFIVRTIDPHSGTHIFHMIYIDRIYDIPTYENLFRLFILLRDVLFRMHIKRIVMPKIGCRCDQFHFGQVLKMIKYVFLDSHIQVIIGLKSKRWWCAICSRSNESFKENNMSPEFDIFRNIFSEENMIPPVEIT